MINRETKPWDMNLRDVLAHIDPLDEFFGFYFPQSSHVLQICWQGRKVLKDIWLLFFSPEIKIHLVTVFNFLWAWGILYTMKK